VADTLNPDRLERARARQLRHLPAAATVLRRTAGTRDRGVTPYTWAPVTVNPPAWAPGDLWPAALAGRLPVRLSSPTRAEVELAAERWGANPVWTVTGPWAAPVAIGDRLELELPAGSLLVAVFGDYTAGASYATATRLAATEAV
jgi:hypothetical protein